MMAAMFDHQLLLIDDLKLNELVSCGPAFVNEVLKGVTKKDEILALLSKHISSNRRLNSQATSLAKTLLEVCKTRDLKNHEYWNNLQTVVSSQSDSHGVFVASAGIRRGLSKLLCFDAKDRKSILGMARSSNLGAVANFAIGLGWAIRAPGGKLARIDDDDIKTLASSLQDAVIEQTVANIPSSVLTGMTRTAIDPCRNAGERLTAICTYFSENSTSFSDISKLVLVFKSGFIDPTFGGKVPATSPWIFEFCLAIGKAIADRAQGFGLSQLARTIELKDPDSVRFWGPAYESGKAMPSDEQLKAISRVFASQCKVLLSRSGSPDVAGQACIKWMAHTLVEVKLCTYPTFKPAELIVAQAAINSGYKVATSHLYASPVFSNSRSGGQTKGLVAVKGKKRIFIKVQSGAMNTRDKAKELAGRIASSFALRAGGKFSSGFDESVLILDGPFKVAEAELCQMSGWNIVTSLEKVAEIF
jgi:hypothetical protein